MQQASQGQSSIHEVRQRSYGCTVTGASPSGSFLMSRRSWSVSDVPVIPLEPSSAQNVANERSPARLGQECMQSSYHLGAFANGGRDAFD